MRLGLLCLLVVPMVMGYSEKKALEPYTYASEKKEVGLFFVSGRSFYVDDPPSASMEKWLQGHERTLRASTTDIITKFQLSPAGIAAIVISASTFILLIALVGFYIKHYV